MRGLVTLLRKGVPLFLFSLCLTTVPGPSSGQAADLRDLESILGRTGEMQEEALVFRFPRSDIQVTIDGDPVPTALGFGGWTAWKEMGNEAMVMGDLVLLEKEINPVISALAEADIQVSALHNHFVGERPRLMYLHIYGMGEATTMARGLRSALDQTATPKPQLPPPSPTPQPKLNLDTKRIEQIIGRSGASGGGVFKITVRRRGVTMDGLKLTASMGLNSWAAFVGTDELAHVAGDIAMTGPEVNRVIRALRSGSIDIVAVHNHMLSEEPRIFFLHYWGTGKAEELARTVHQAFEEVKEEAR
jgi:hypothetical protein